MAYAAVVTLSHLSGRKWKVTIAETDAGPATEATIEGLPIVGRVQSQRCSKISGAANTVAPILVTTSASAAAIDTIVQATASADHSNLLDPAAPYDTTNGTLYHRSVCDTGLSVITTIYYIEAGTW